MRQPPLVELGTALAWLLTVSVVGALVVALAAVEARRAAPSTSWRARYAAVVLAALVALTAGVPDWVGFLIAVAGLLTALGSTLEKRKN